MLRREVPPRLAERPELRRLLDGVGQPGEDADREALNLHRQLASQNAGKSPLMRGCESIGGCGLSVPSAEKQCREEDGQSDEDRSQQEGANGRALVQVKSVPYDQKSEIDESKPGKHPHEQDEKEHVETTRPSRSWGPGSRRRAFRPIGRSDGATRRRCHYCCAPVVVLGAFHGLLIDGNTFCNPLKAVSDNLSEEFQGSDENFTFPGMFSARGARGLPRRK